MDFEQTQPQDMSQPQQNSGFVPAPASPAGVPGIPEGAGQADMSQEEMMANLNELMGKIQNKYQDFNSGKAISDSKVMQAKSQALREVFDILQSAGVDPSNVEQVQQFLNKIKELNPELYQQIEQILGSLIGEEETNQEAPLFNNDVSQNVEGSVMSGQNMNINNTNEQASQNI